MKLTREQLEKKTNRELIQMQRQVWVIGADDDAEFVARCTPIKNDTARERVIQFLLDVDAQS